MPYPLDALYLDLSDDLEPDTLSIQGAFEVLENDILIRVGHELGFEVRLILEIMKLSARDGAEEYFLGHMFKYHCYLLGLDSEDLLETIVRKNLGKTAIRGSRRYNEVLGKEEEIREKYKSGAYTKKMLAKEFHVRESALTPIIVDLPQRRRTEITESFVDDVVNSRMAGKTIKAIAREFNVDNGKIAGILKTLGLNKRKNVKKIYHIEG